MKNTFGVIHTAKCLCNLQHVLVSVLVITRITQYSSPIIGSNVVFNKSIVIAGYN